MRMYSWMRGRFKVLMVISDLYSFRFVVKPESSSEAATRREFV